MNVVSFATREPLKAASQPRIDWTKVPQGTPVKVWDSTCTDYTRARFVCACTLDSHSPFVVMEWESPTKTDWQYCLLDTPPLREWEK